VGDSLLDTEFSQLLQPHSGPREWEGTSESSLSTTSLPSACIEQLAFELAQLARTNAPSCKSEERLSTKKLPTTDGADETSIKMTIIVVAQL